MLDCVYSSSSLINIEIKLLLVEYKSKCVWSLSMTWSIEEYIWEVDCHEVYCDL